ncbi:hypothetical protein ABW19_dt0210216 [Dactylella cylindrospora]|nr:hypothetical protein ABW19_dt0210216 [Dactylella cylindrospora]
MSAGKRRPYAFGDPDSRCMVSTTAVNFCSSDVFRSKKGFRTWHRTTLTDLGVSTFSSSGILESRGLCRVAIACSSNISNSKPLSYKSFTSRPKNIPKVAISSGKMRGCFAAMSVRRLERYNFGENNTVGLGTRSLHA